MPTASDTAVTAESDRHHDQQAALAVLALKAARRTWQRLDPRELAAWSSLSMPLASTLSAIQYTAAVDAARYVAAVAGPAVAEVVPAAFAGVASDGRPMLTLLDQPRIRVLTRIRDGMAVPDAMASGLSALETIAVTQVQDTGRAAAGTAIVARPDIGGYVRHLRPPSCSRCAVLAGQFYRWNAGFLRHPRCDCRHVPVSKKELYRDEVTSPKAYFDSLARTEQDRVFTNAGAQAIRDGADLASVVNARRGMQTATVHGRQVQVTSEGMTRRGAARQHMGRDAQVRLMPEAIYADAVDRDDAIRLLERFGYVR